MPDYDFGSSQWWGNVFNQFLDPTDTVWGGYGDDSPLAEQDIGLPDPSDWYSGWNIAGSYDIESENLADWALFSNPSSIWELPNEWNFGSPFTSGAGGSPYFQNVDDMPVMIDYGQWMSDWGSYLPTFNTQDLLDAGTIGALQKNKNIADVLAKYSAAGKNIDRFIQRTGHTELDYLYDAALATGRLSDFKTQANIFDIQSGMEAEAYGAVGDIAAQGAFDWGEINESPYWFTTVVPQQFIPEYPGDTEASPFCDAQCYDYCQGSTTSNNPEVPGSIETCEECWSNCLVFGYWGG